MDFNLEWILECQRHFKWFNYGKISQNPIEWKLWKVSDKKFRFSPFSINLVQQKSSPVLSIDRHDLSLNDCQLQLNSISNWGRWEIHFCKNQMRNWTELKMFEFHWFYVRFAHQTRISIDWACVCQCVEMHLFNWGSLRNYWRKESNSLSSKNQNDK